MTNPDLHAWPPSDRRYRRSEATALVGSGEPVWERVADEVLRWRVKTASRFGVGSPEPVSRGDRVAVTTRCLGVTVVEPVEVVAVVQEPDRVGFAYRTLPGHPASGEEAFIVHRHGDQVHLTVRSLTRAASQQRWRAPFPLLRVAQRIVRERYLRALL